MRGRNYFQWRVTSRLTIVSPRALMHCLLKEDTMTEKTNRPIVYWGMTSVALHYMAHGERISKKALMLELPRTPENERLLLSMCNAGRESLGLLRQGK